MFVSGKERENRREEKREILSTWIPIVLYIPFARITRYMSIYLRNKTSPYSIIFVPQIKFHMTLQSYFDLKIFYSQFVNSTLSTKFPINKKFKFL